MVYEAFYENGRIQERAAMVLQKKMLVTGL